jgi:Zn-finger nucleic acid-binding protein
MKCPKCGYWNRIEVNKLFIEQKTSEPKVKAYIPMYKSLKVETCKKCKGVIAEPKELIRIVKHGKRCGTFG